MEKSGKRTENNHGVFWIYGDSVGRRFYNDIANTSNLCNGVFSKCDHTVNKIYNVIPGETKRDGKDLNITRMMEELLLTLRKPVLLDDPNSAVLINYGLHFVMDTPFSHFIDVIEVIARTLEHWKSLGKATLIWKSTNAMNKWKYGWPDDYKKHDKMQRFLSEPVS